MALVAVFACSVAYAAHTSHYWTKVSETDGVNGQVVCQVFVPSGAGMKRAYEICDILKGLLDQKVISGYLQTTNSFITTIGVDVMDSSLFNVNYTVNFISIN